MPGGVPQNHMLIALTCAAPLLLCLGVAPLETHADTSHGASHDTSHGASQSAFSTGDTTGESGKSNAAPQRGRGGANPATGSSGNVAAARGTANADGSEAVTITSEDKFAIAGSYWGPKAHGDRVPGVILLHDAGSTREDFGDLPAQLNKRGFAVLSIDLRGHGSSVSERADFEKASPEEQKGLWAFSTRDVQAAATWLRQRPEVHSTNLNLVGVGAGVGLAVRHAARDENVRSLVLLRPCVDQLGFDLAADLRAIEGLPAYIAAPGDVRDQVKDLLGPMEGLNTVEVNYIRDAEGPLLDARRLPRTIVNWVGEQALPKRGRS